MCFAFGDWGEIVLGGRCFLRLWPPGGRGYRFCLGVRRGGGLWGLLVRKLFYSLVFGTVGPSLGLLGQ